MPIRAQCDNCGKVYNLPDESAGKRLRCKQCAVAFTVPSLALAAEAPTLGPQKICVVCGQNVAGRPRTKDQAGNYYCRSCYEEKARTREQLAQSRVGAAVPAGVGGGDGEGEMIDLAALEPTEQFDESAQPAPPPIDDLMAPPIPDEEPIMAEPVMLEVPPRPKKKKKKKKGAAASASTDSFLSKLGRFPIEAYIVAVALVLAGLGMVSNAMTGWCFLLLGLLGLGCMLWGNVCIIIAAFGEGVGTGLMYMFLPIYWLIFIGSHWAEVRRHVGRAVLGGVLIVGGGMVMDHYHPDHDSDDDSSDVSEDGPSPAKSQDLATDPAYSIVVDLQRPPTDAAAMEKQIASTIEASLKKRNIKPTQGKLMVEASVAPSLDATHKMKMNGRDTKLPSPKLVCSLLVKDSAEKTIYEDSRDSLPDPAMLNLSAGAKKSGADFQKELWKNVPTEFQTLADAVPAPAAGGAASSNGSAK